MTKGSPVPELSFLPAPYKGRAKRRVQDNLHAHARNAAIFSPQIGGKNHVWKYSPDLVFSAISQNNILQATIFAFWFEKNMSVNA